MRAAKLWAPRQFRVVDEPDPGPPGPGQVRLRIAYVGICGSDLHYYREGHLHGAAVTEPFVVGHEYSAVVEEVGEGVEGVRPGDRVAVDPAVSCGRCEWCLSGNPNLCPWVQFSGSPPVPGAMQEVMLHPATEVFVLPKGLTLQEGALVEPLSVALHAVDLGKVRLAERVGVIGVGPIGLLTVALLHLAGAVEIWAADVLPWRLALARELGATHLVDASRDPVAQVRDGTGGRGLDAVFEATGEPEGPWQAVEWVRPGGRVVLVGISDGEGIQVPAGPARRKGVTIKLDRRARRTYRRALDLVERRGLPLGRLITHMFPLNEVGRAFAVVDGREDGVVKALVEVSPPR